MCRTIFPFGGPIVIIELESVFAREGEKKEINYEFSIDDENIITPVKVVGSVFNRTGIVYLEAHAGFDYSTSCARCSRPLLRHARVPVNHILVSHLDDEDADEMYVIVENMHFNPDEVVQEDIYLAIPTRFLCKEDCKGLCPICGKDLNDGPCDCKKPTDPRWDALKDLLN